MIGQSYCGRMEPGEAEACTPPWVICLNSFSMMTFLMMLTEEPLNLAAIFRPCMMAFPYQTLNKGSEIRLLEIKPLTESMTSPFSLQVHDLSRLPVYEAISYAWGHFEFDSSITCDGKRLPVTSACATMLSYLRHGTECKLVWIDQICINQGNIPERNDQVLLMTEIYSRAQQVIVWVGECNEDEKMCLEEVAQFNLPKVRAAAKAVGMPYYESSEGHLWRDGGGWARVTLKGILSRPYFFRMWIVQEVIVARGLTMRCGDYSLDMDRLFDVVTLIFLIIWAQGGDHYEPWTAVLALKNLRQDYLQYGTLDYQEKGFEALFLDTRNRLVSDYRDKIYALRGICRYLRENTPLPDYGKSDAQVFIETASASNKSDKGRLTILKADRSPRHGTDLPTWCPDYGGPIWNIQFRSHSSERLWERSRRPDSLPIIDGKRLIVRGKIVDTVAKVSETTVRYDPDDQHLSDLTKAFETWRAWFSYLEQASASHGGKEPRHVSFWSALINNTDWFKNEAAEKERDAVRILGCIEALHARLMEYDPTKRPCKRQWADPFVKQCVNFALDHSLAKRACITEEGFFGLVVRQAKVGDVVVYLEGADTPYALRPLNHDRGVFTLVGPCYVLGLMNGEKYPLEDSEMGEIVIV